MNEPETSREGWVRRKSGRFQQIVMATMVWSFEQVFSKGLETHTGGGKPLRLPSLGKIRVNIYYYVPGIWLSTSHVFKSQNNL